jgi:cytochrome c oxidase assembly factor 2
MHPRSRLTSSLFATTLLASFLVVGLPHVIPCPAPRIAYADGETDIDGTPKRRKRRKCPNPDGSRKEGLNEAKEQEDGLVDDEDSVKGGGGETRLRRECPVPKPSGIVGEILGFKSDSSREQSKTSKRPP